MSLRVDVSLWSADLANLAAEIARIEPFADSFHLDVCDSRFAPGLLFFPDLVAAVRRRTRLPLHVHLMVERPSELARAFIEAGADLVTVHVETGEREAGTAIEIIRHAKRSAGLALCPDTPVRAAAPYLDRIESLLLLGTAPGVKGCDLDPRACDRVREARHWGAPRIVADGGIREHTVPALLRAGADSIVPGSLVFKSPDIAATFQWLRSLTVAE